MMNKLIACTAVVIFSLASFSGCASREVLKPPPMTSAVTEKEVSPVTRDSEGNKAIVEDGRQETAVVADKYSVGDMEGQGAERSNALETIYFDYDSANLSTEAREAIYRNFQVLAGNTRVTTQIEGHCDERGSDDYNLALGENRAKATMRYLVSLGIADERLSTISYGKEKPAVARDDETAWAKNRRAEFVLDRTEK